MNDNNDMQSHDELLKLIKDSIEKSIGNYTFVPILNDPKQMREMTIDRIRSDVYRSASSNGLENKINHYTIDSMKWGRISISNDVSDEDLSEVWIYIIYVLMKLDYTYDVYCRGDYIGKARIEELDSDASPLMGYNLIINPNAEATYIGIDFSLSIGDDNN